MSSPVQPKQEHTDSTKTAPGEVTLSGDRSTASQSLPSNTGRYLLGEEIARGGMGEVYRATDTVLNREIAIKVLQAKFEPTSRTALRFDEEAKITAQLQHPSIPAVHDLGTLPDGRPFLAMKLIKGETLEKLLKQRTSVESERGRFLAVFEAICQAVGYAHAHDVIHRDLKPANIMVGAFGEVQVMDWGLAKVLPSRGRQSTESDSTDPNATTPATEIKTTRDIEDALTQAGSVMGTPAFIPPEQALGAIHAIDQRSDVFGLGGILVMILTGQAPFESDSSQSALIMASDGNIQPCFERLRNCGAEPEWIDLCKKCLQPNRSERYRNASEVARVVGQLRAEAEERARQAELETVRIEGERAKQAEQRKHRRTQFALVLATFLILLLAVFGAVVASLWRNVESQREQLAVFEYGRTMQVAHQQWRDNNIAGMRELLDATNPNHRGWEWNYLNRLADPSLSTLKGHTSRVNSASFSPDGSQIVTGSEDSTAKVWDAKTGAEVLTLKRHSRTSVGARSASFSPDGSRIVTGIGDIAKVWDAKTGVEILRLIGHTNGVYSARFNVDGSRIVTGSSDNTAKVWDAKTGSDVITLKGDIVRVRSTSLSADGSRMVGPSLFDNTAKVWDAKTMAEILTLSGHTKSVLSASFSADGTRIVTAGSDNTAKVWDAKAGAELLTLKGHTIGISSACFSPDGLQIHTHNADGTVKIYDSRPFRDSRPPDVELGPLPRAVK